MHTLQLKKKIIASAIHLIFSAILVCSVCAAIYFIWYPDQLLFLTDADKILGLILIVDICIGPFLTFIVFNEQKQELKRDLRIIVSIQVIALIYGIYTVGIARPAYVVFSVDRFEITYASQLTKSELQKVTRDEFKNKPPFWQKPIWISAEFPTDIEERNDLLFQAIDGRDLGQTPKYFRELHTAKEQIIKKAKQPNQKQLQMLPKHPNNSEISPSYKILPIVGKTKDFSVVIDTSNLEIISILNIEPWSS